MMVQTMSNDFMQFYYERKGGWEIALMQPVHDEICSKRQFVGRTFNNPKFLAGIFFVIRGAIECIHSICSITTVNSLSSPSIIVTIHHSSPPLFSSLIVAYIRSTAAQIEKAHPTLEVLLDDNVQAMIVKFATNPSMLFELQQTANSFLEVVQGTNEKSLIQIKIYHLLSLLQMKQCETHLQRP
jgi:hypothetical protein